MRLTCGRALVWFFARIVLLETVGQCYGQEAKKTEFCETEDFVAKCNPNEVVAMENALYGRMKLGRCVRTDYGYVGCSTDVRSYLDSICSGRRSCSLRLPNPQLDELKECPREFKTYLLANYTCIPVESSQCNMCQTSKVARVTGTSGYLGSVVTNETKLQSECGSSKCPWLLQVNPGQRINLTLFDFSTTNNKGHGSFDGCSRLAVIKEKLPSAPSSGLKQHDSPVCAGGGRVRHLYTSSTNEIEIHVISPEVFSNKGQFLFYFQAIGCADIPTEPNFYFRRKNDRKAVGGCVTNAVEWEMACVDSNWEGGEKRWQCPQDILPPGQATGKPSFTLPLGVLVAIIIGIALVIGVLILTIGLVCFKSYAHRRQPVTYRRPDSYGSSRHRRSSAFHEEMSAATPLQYAKHPPEAPPDKHHVPPNIRENVYMESRPLPSLPHQNDTEVDDKSDRSSKVQVYRTSSGREHYHNPRLVVNTRYEAPYGMPIGDSYDPQYFVLDPDDELTVELPPSPCCVAASGPPSGPPRRHVPGQMGQMGRGGMSSAKQKSPEEENAENFCKEVVASLNNSCQELPISPIPPPLAVTCTNPNNYRGGNCSWP